MKRETAIYIIKEMIYFVLLILGWFWFWLLVDIELTDWRFFAVFFVVIFLMMISAWRARFP